MITLSDVQISGDTHPRARARLRPRRPGAPDGEQSMKGDERHRRRAGSAALLRCWRRAPARTGWGTTRSRFASTCNVPDATVWVDDVLVGKVADWKCDGQHIRAGFHRIEVRHPNYYSFFQEVELPGGSNVVVNAKLREL